MIPSYPSTLSHICVLHKPRDKVGSKGWLLPKVFCLLCHGTVLIVSEYFCVAGNMDEYTSLYQHEPSIHRGLTYLVILCNSERVLSLQKIRNNFECACTDCFMYKHHKAVMGETHQQEGMYTLHTFSPVSLCTPALTLANPPAVQKQLQRYHCY